MTTRTTGNDSKGEDTLRWRTALVTGSSNGIGEAIVKQLAGLDFKLVVTGRSSEDIKRVADECELLSPSRLRPLEIIADMALEEDVKRLFDASLEHFGQRLDLLVNNAGLSTPGAHENPIECYEAFKRTMAVNLNSTVQLSLLAIGPLKRTSEQNGQATNIVMISSIAAYKPLEDFAYCVSKCGMTMLSNCLAGKLGPSIRVNSINPGPIETKLAERSGISVENFRTLSEHVAPLKRTGTAKEVADAVVFLADPERAAYITGSQLLIDGGVMCNMVKF
uniref:Granaticin polyketide synthase putative ketoacyl reductase 2 n=1 Tax=Aceria tosichella TaxID=561515 RepID=A0A6G1SMA5_9ACAR